MQQVPDLLLSRTPRENVVVPGVLDGDQVVACMSVLQMTHFEGLWIDPDRRGDPGVLRALLRLGHAVPLVRGEPWVVAQVAEDPKADHFLAKMGGLKMHAATYMLPVRSW